jgi:hypothetical protein
MKMTQNHSATREATNKASFFPKDVSRIGEASPFFGSVSTSSSFIQAKNNDNQHSDPNEQMTSSFFNTENSVSFFNNGAGSIQRKCSSCEQEHNQQMLPAGEKDMQETIQRKTGDGESAGSGNVVESSLSRTKGNGSPMPDALNESMSNSLAFDFSDVKIHTDSSAVQLSTDLNAQAFTHGNDIYFNDGKYNTNSREGKHLLAHELTHVVQQSTSNENVINRSVNDNSTCDNTVDTSAPPNPLISIILLDSMAGMHLNMAKLTLTLDMMQSSGVPGGKGFDAYRRRFGDPAAVRNKFRNRFNGSLFDTLVDAQISEMNSLISILDRLSNVLARDINYRCIGPHIRTIGGVRFDCTNSGFVLTSFNGVNRIIICPGFWNLSASQQGIGIIHEAVHILFPFGDHDTAPAQTSNERRTEPECYASLVADINNVQPFDGSCPPV